MNEAEAPPLEFPWWVGWPMLRFKLQKYLQHRCAAHNIAIIKHLPRYLKRLLEDMHGIGYSSETFDLYVLLGDLVTWPNQRAFSFLREYLTSRRYETGDDELRHVCACLDIPPQKLVMIPGNHDKFFQTSLDMYHAQVTRRLGLPQEPKPRECYFQSRKIGGIELLFILVDASVYAERQLKIDRSCRDHFASGYINPSVTSDIFQKLMMLKQGQDVDDARLDRYSDATKILLIHYPVDLQIAGGGAESLKNLVLPHECRGIRELMDKTASELSLVIHGHLHVARLYRQWGVPVVSVDTTCQKGGSNGFFVLKIFDSGEIIAEHHRWRGTGFLLDDDLRGPLA